MSAKGTHAVLAGVLGCFLVTGFPAAAFASSGQAVRIDDSGTVVVDPVLEMLR